LQRHDAISPFRSQTPSQPAHRICSMPIVLQLVWLFVLAIPIASIAWTITHEEIFRETREYCKRQCEPGRNVFRRKFFYLFTCEYCFCYYVVILTPSHGPLPSRCSNPPNQIFLLGPTLGPDRERIQHVER